MDDKIFEDQAAIQIMAGLVAGASRGTAEAYAEKAYRFVDALMEHRKRRREAPPPDEP